jgi:hypothetical protein
VLVERASKTRVSAYAMDRSTKPSFNFVNLNHPDDLKDEETQLRIRRLAMTEVGKARRKPKTKRARNEIVLDFRNPSESRVEIDRLGNGQLDPFCSYPVDLDDSDRALLANSECIVLLRLACFLTWCSLQYREQQPSFSVTRILVPGWTQRCGCLVQYARKLSKLFVSEAQRLLSFPRRCCFANAPSQGASPYQ